MDQEREKRLGKYLLKAKLGQGGMGVVYLATDLRLKRDVALKILPRSMSKDPVAAKRFLREARVAAQLSHPHVVTIHDVDQQEGLCFLVMELLTGGTAQDLIANGPLDWQEATRIIADACRGLSAIHQRGMVHRDIKPSNLMRTEEGVVKLADFGLVKVAAEAGVTGLTHSNAVMGTPQYMSPEQCQGEQLDGRSDLYSLGAAYYALLTGEAPYVDSQPLQVMFAHCSKPIPDPRRVSEDIPAACVEVVTRAMAKARADRFATADEMVAALTRCLTSETGGSQTARRTVAVHTGDSGSDFTLSGGSRTVKREAGGTTIVAGAKDADTASIRHGWQRVLQQRPVQIAVGCVLLLLAVLGGSQFLRGRGTASVAGNSAASRKAGSRQANSGQPRPVVARKAGDPIALEFEASIATGQAQTAGAVFSNDGRSFYSGSLDGDVRAWSVATRKVIREYAGVRQGIRAIAAYDPWVAAGGVDKTVWIWDVDEEQPRAALTGFAGDIRAMTFSPDGRRLVVGTYGDARLFDMEQSPPRLIKVLGTSVSGEVLCYMVHGVAFSADSRQVAVATWESKAVGIWDADTGDLKHVKRGLEEEPTTVAFVPDKNEVLIGCEHAGLYRWDLANQQVRKLPFSSDINVRTLVVTADGRTAFVVGQWDGRVHLFDLQTEDQPRRFDKATGTSSLGVCLSADESRLLTAGGEPDHRKGFIYLWKIVSAAP